jgi:two-component system nitrogen regulation response regulator GlnG
MTASDKDRRAVVWLVDDDTRTSRRLARMLEEDGYAVEVLRDGADAALRFGRSPVPDVLVTDLMMPGMSGVALMKEARRWWPVLPVIIMTGYPERVPRDAGEPGLAPTVFTKPIDYAVLTSELSRVTMRRVP